MAGLPGSSWRAPGPWALTDQILSPEPDCPLILPDHREKGRESPGLSSGSVGSTLVWPASTARPCKEEQLTAWARSNCFRTMAVWPQNRQGALLQTFFSRPSSLKKHCEHTKAVGNMAAAKWLPSCPTLCDPIDGSPPGSPWALSDQTVSPKPDYLLILPDHRAKGRESPGLSSGSVGSTLVWPASTARPCKQEQLTAWARSNCFRTMAVWPQNRQGALLQTFFSRPSRLKKHWTHKGSRKYGYFLLSWFEETSS